MSTRAEQIAAVKRVIEECVANGYDDFPDDPHTFGHLTSMRAVLATLQGMAAPGENERAMEVIRRAAALIEKGDSPSPQQPTQETEAPHDFPFRNLAREVLAAVVQRLNTPDDGSDQIEAWAIIERALTAVAAQRVTAIEAQLATVREGAEALIKQAVRERDAATDKARREAIEECARFVENGVFLTDSSPAYHFAKECAAGIRRALTPQNPGIKCAVYSQVPPYRMRCEKCLAAGRCLESATAQNPGDAAPESGR